MSGRVKRGRVKAGGAATLDWEEKLGSFLEAAIAAPEREVAICEDLIEYVQFLVRQDRATYQQKAATVVFRLYGKERRVQGPKFRKRSAC